MPEWLKKQKWRFSEYKWYRKWYGGSWTLWRPKIDCADTWFPSEYRPGCVFPKPLRVELYSTKG